MSNTVEKSSAVAAALRTPLSPLAAETTAGTGFREVFEGIDTVQFAVVDQW
jgi:hypothetical protein